MYSLANSFTNFCKYLIIATILKIILGFFFELKSGHIKNKVKIWFEVKKTGKLLAKISKKLDILVIFGKYLIIATILQKNCDTFLFEVWPHQG